MVRQSQLSRFLHLIHCVTISVHLTDTQGRSQMNQFINLIHCDNHYLNTPVDYTIRFTSI